MVIHRYAATVINDTDTVVGMNNDVDPRAEAGQSFVYRVVHYFIVIPVLPMYMAGLFRTASSPFSVLMLSALYCCSFIADMV